MLAHLAIQLAGAPAGIAQHHVPAPWPVAARNRLQYVERGGEGPGAANLDGAGGGIIGAVQHKAAPRFHRPAGQHRHVGCHPRCDVQLRQQAVQGKIGHRLVDHQTQRPGVIMQAHGNHGAVKPVIANAGHRQQQLARKIRRRFHGHKHRRALDASQGQG